MNLRDLGWKCGKYPMGERNDITDVPGVSVGHHTIIKGEGKLIPGQGPIRTGVTIVKPHEGIIYNQKVPAGVFVANGYGKSTGIPQILELGWIETPIAITNTFNVGLVYDALISYSIETNPNIGITLSSCCPIVTECNDSYLNDIQGRHVKQSHVLDVLKNLDPNKPVEQGCVGAGTGMTVFGLKSGVGTASRQLKINLGKYHGTYHIGVLSVPNFGNYQDFTFYGHEMKEILDKEKYVKKKGKDANKYKKEGISYSREYHNIYTASQTLFREEGICNDFAELYAAMVRSRGIKVKKIWGYTDETKHVGHMWNLVDLDGDDTRRVNGNVGP